MNVFQWCVKKPKRKAFERSIDGELNDFEKVIRPIVRLTSEYEQKEEIVYKCHFGDHTTEKC